MAEEKPKKKRLIRPSQTTVREKAEQSQRASEKPKKTGKARQKLSPVGRFFAKVFRPFKWLLRHIVPRYFRNSFTELRNVTWPSLKQSRQLTFAVIIFAAVFAAIISVLDLGLEAAFKRVFLK